MIVLLLSACSEPKTETQTENGENADDSKRDAPPSLAGIIASGTIPQDLCPYNEIVRTILTPYASGAAIVARYVTEAGAGNKDGSSWENAKAGTDLHTTLLNIDASSNKVYLLLIGNSEYTVGNTLAMKNHVAIVGGWDSNEYWARTTDTHTILSGDNTRRVFKNNDINNTAVLYGVVITKGKDALGGGMYNRGGSSPVLMNVTFSGNTASTGGGMYNRGGSSPVLMNVTFSGNTASTGGGMYNRGGSSPVLTNVTFSGNTAEEYYGGGMNNWNSSPVLTNVTFSRNTAKQEGGGMFNNDSSSPVLMNVTFSGNTAGYGGGISNYLSSPVLANVTFSRNTAKQEGGGMFNEEGSPPMIVNAVFWGNTASTGPQIYAYGGGTITFAYSIIDRGDTTNGIVLTKGLSELPRAVVIAPEYTDPSLTALANNGSFVSTHAITSDSSAVNIGLYIRRKNKTFYYSEDGNDWYTGFDGSELAISSPLPIDAIDLTATDATGHKRTGRPDAGAYEAR